MNKRTLIFLGTIVLLSGWLGFFSLTRGHPWWDDFASYLMQAKSILTWTMGDFIQHNSFTVLNSSYPPGPVAYPWGFPLILAPVYAVFGPNPLALKMVSLVFYAFFLVSTALLARTRLPDVEAVLVTGVLAFAPALVASNDLILSDIPFLAFSTFSLYLIERFSCQGSRSGIAVGASIFMAFFLRTNGILLIAPLLISLLVRAWPNWQAALRKATQPFFILVGLIVLQALIFPGGQSSYFSHFNMFSPQHLLDNVVYYLWLPALTFDQIPGGFVLYPLLAVFMLISLYKHSRRDAALHAYSLLTVLAFIVWPERQGLRFIYPVLPFLLISAVDGMCFAVDGLKKDLQNFAQSVLRGFLGLVLLVCLGLSALSAYQITVGGREINGPFDLYSKQMYAFVREKTAADSVIIFVRPRALRLFTDRDAFMTENCSDLVKGDYVILHLKMEANGQVSPEQVNSCNPNLRLDEVFRNKRFLAYKITP